MRACDWFARSLQAAGISDFTWHNLCHTFASRLHMWGVELATIKDLCGHRTWIMALRYVHRAPGYPKKAVDRTATSPAEEEKPSERLTQ